MQTANILVFTGASGSGKTTAVKGLEARSLPNVRCFYFDQIGIPSMQQMQRDFGSPEAWQAAATKEWITRLAAQAVGNLVCVLDGQTRPSFVRAAVSELGNASARITLVECSPAVRRARLQLRGQPELATQDMENWAIYLRGQADALELPIINTSELTVDEVIDALAAQVLAMQVEIRNAA